MASWWRRTSVSDPMTPKDWQALYAAIGTSRRWEPKTGALWECPHCQDRIRSMHRHDFVTCKCGKTSVDGGGEYDRMSWEDKPPIKVGP